MKALLVSSKLMWRGWVSNRYNTIILPVSEGVGSSKFGPRDVERMKRFFVKGNVWVYHKVDRFDVKYQFPNIMLRRQGCPVVLDARDLNSFDPLNDLIESLVKVSVPVKVLCFAGQVLLLRPFDGQVIVDSVYGVPELSFSKWDFWLKKKVRSVLGRGVLVVDKFTDV